MTAVKKKIVIDVRKPEEFQKAHAAGSINIPLDEIPGRLEEIKKLKGEITVVCGGGTRNGKAHTLLSENGVENTAGGSWKQHG